MDSLSDLLSKKDFEAPDELEAIKLFVRSKYQVEVGAQLRDNDIIVTASSAALVARLRYDTPALQSAAKTEKRIILRIGS